MIRVGCSGWSYEHWRDDFYDSAPSSRWLERFAAVFDTVELNATFYRLPKPSTVKGWAKRTPDEFCFAVKASRYLTHVRRLRDLSDGVARFMSLLEPLSEADKLGSTLWQLPPYYRRDDERLAGALAELPAGRHAFEFRDPSWFTDDVYALLRERHVASRRGPQGASGGAVGRHRRLVVSPLPPRSRGQARELLAARAGRLGGAHRPCRWRRLRVLQQRLGGIRSRERAEAARARGCPVACATIIRP